MLLFAHQDMILDHRYLTVAGQVQLGFVSVSSQGLCVSQQLLPLATTNRGHDLMLVVHNIKLLLL